MRMQRCRSTLVLLLMLVAACVPTLKLDDAPCQEGACSPGYACCQERCQPAAEQCLGRCLEPESALAERFMPFVPGSVWIYDVRDTDSQQYLSTKHLRLGEEEPTPFVGGVAHRLCREDRNSSDTVDGGAIRWERDTGHAAVWIRSLRLDAGGVTKDESSSPYAVRVDESAERICEGARFRSDWTSRLVELDGCPGYTPVDPSQCPVGEVFALEEWTVDAIDEMVEVPGLGPLPALKVTRTTTEGDLPPEIATFWFVRGVGKIREVTLHGETEELVHFEIPDGPSGGAQVGRVLPACTPAWWPQF